MANSKNNLRFNESSFNQDMTNYSYGGGRNIQYFRVQQPTEYLKTFKGKEGNIIDVYQESKTTNQIPLNSPNLPELTSLQKSKDYVESSHHLNEVYTPGYHYRHHHQMPVPMSPRLPQSINIPVTVKSPQDSHDSTNEFIQKTEIVKPTETISEVKNHDHEHCSDEKTVTIKKKVIRRTKHMDKVDTLRDSFIDDILKSMQPINNKYPSDSDSDDVEEETMPVEKKPNNKRPIMHPPSPPVIEEPMQSRPEKPVQSAPPPPVNENQRPIIEEPMNRLQKPKAQSEIPFKNLDKLDKATINQTPQNYEKAPVYQTPQTYDKAPVYQTPQTYDKAPVYQTPPNYQKPPLSDMNNQETFIQEKDAAPYSTYSARRENMKAQQMLKDRSPSVRTMPVDRRTNETTEEVETITLQPIGKGVQDLASHTTTSRPPSRAATPRVNESATMRSYYREDNSQHMNNAGDRLAPNTVFNTMPYSAHRLNKTQSAKNIHNISNFESSTMDTRQRAGRSSARSPTFQTIQPHHQQQQQQQQSVNTSWQTRSETYRHGSSAAHPPTVMSPISQQESYGGNIIVSEDYVTLQQVLNCEDLWYRPQYNRDQVINALRDKPAGSFIIRNSTTFSGAYGLALKVHSLPPNVTRSNDLQSDLIRHFLIETVEDEHTGGTTGVRLKGLANEGIYPSLAHLVQAHCAHEIALPNCLILPVTRGPSLDVVDYSNTTGTGMGMSGGAGMQTTTYEYETRQHERFGADSSHQQQQQQQQQIQQQHQQQQHAIASSSSAAAAANTSASVSGFATGARTLNAYQRSQSTSGVNYVATSHSNPLHRQYMVTALYLGKIDVDRNNGDKAVDEAITKALNKTSNRKAPLKTTTVEILMDSTAGMTITDKLHKLFYTRQFPAQHVLYGGFDPKQREFNCEIMKTNGITKGRILGVVVRKQKVIMRENAVHVFCEIDNINDLGGIISFINDHYVRRM